MDFYQFAKIAVWMGWEKREITQEYFEGPAKEEWWFCGNTWVSPTNVKKSLSRAEAMDALELLRAKGYPWNIDTVSADYGAAMTIMLGPYENDDTEWLASEGATIPAAVENALLKLIEKEVETDGRN